MKKNETKLKESGMELNSSLDLLAGSTPKASQLSKKGKAVEDVAKEVSKTTKPAKTKSLDSASKQVKDKKETENKAKEVKGTKEISTTKKVETKEKTESKSTKSKKDAEKPKEDAVVEDIPATNIKKSRSSKGSNLVGTDEELEDLEKINEEGLKSQTGKGKRKQYIIVILSILLVATISFLTTFLILTHVDKNCDLNVYGNVKAEYLIEGKEKSQLRLPSNIRSNTILHLDLDMEIKSGGQYNVKYKISCYFNGEALRDFDVYEPNREFFQYIDGFFVSIEPLSGEFNLCKGVVINNEFGSVLNSSGFRMVVDTYIERA